MRILYLVSFLCFSGPCALRGQAYTVYDSFSQLETRIQQLSEKTTVVINFWATWCGPCVEELPCFEELNQKYAGPDFQVWLVSLDFKSRLEKQFLPFLEKNKLKAEVILLADQNADDWIPKVHKDWQGGVPSTLIIRGGERQLHQDQFKSFDELESFVLGFLKTVQQKVKGMIPEGSR